jgi:SagB-type dehydrogenase family enzyme
MNFFLSDLHSDLRGTRLTHRGATHRAEDVPRGTHKAYPRMEQIKLPVPEKLHATLQEALQKRISYFGGSDTTMLSLETCGALFSLALGKRNGSHHRNYPSGGALYPVETYLISAALEGSAPAVFHYNPSGHSLEKLWDLPRGFDMKELARHPKEQLFSSLIVFTAVWDRSSAKYGDLAYQHSLLEAGHMSQNILLIAAALGLRTRPMAGFEDDLIVSLLDLDPVKEQTVHTIVMC